MTRLRLFLILALSATVALAGEVYQLPEGMQGYLDGLELPYVEPGAAPVEQRTVSVEAEAAAGEARAAISADFNGDGKPDFAGLYRYAGPEYRGENLHLDLIIVFTVGDSLEHRIFKYAARRSAEGETILASIAPRSPGRIEEIDGEFDLKTTAIQLDKVSKSYSTFYYWDGKDFAVVTTED